MNESKQDVIQSQLIHQILLTMKKVLLFLATILSITQLSAQVNFSDNFAMNDVLTINPKDAIGQDLSIYKNSNSNALFFNNKKANISPDSNSMPDNEVNLKSDRSDTVNRYSTQDNLGDSINPAGVIIKPDACLKLNPNSTLNLSNNGVIIMEPNSFLHLLSGSKLIVRSGCTFEMKNGAHLKVEGNAKIEVESGGYMCIEEGAIIFLQDELSTINLRPGYISGVNPDVFSGSTSCISDAASAPKSGLGKINTFSNIAFIQNTNDD